MKKVAVSASAAAAVVAVVDPAPSPLLVSLMRMPLDIAAVATEVDDTVAVDVAVAASVASGGGGGWCASTVSRPQQWVASMPRRDHMVHLLLLPHDTAAAADAWVDYPSLAGVVVEEVLLLPYHYCNYSPPP